MIKLPKIFGRKQKPASVANRRRSGAIDAAGLSTSFDNYRADYEMSRESAFVRRRTGLASQGSGADWHYRNERAYYRDIEKARDMDRNDCIVGQTVDRAVQNIVQDGFTLDTSTGDAAIDADLRARWDDWSNDPDQCDIAGESTFHDFETHSCRGMLIDGDCANLGIDGGWLQHLEAHVIQTTTSIDDTVLGVTLDANRERMKYWVSHDPIDHKDLSRERAEPVDVRNAAGERVLFHIYDPKRMSQTRGVTSFAPIFALSGMFEDIQFAKLVQQQVVSCFAIFRQRNHIPDIPLPGSIGGNNSQTEYEVGSRQIDQLVPGLEFLGAPGETLSGFSPNTPNAEYFSHVRLMLQLIGVNLGLPLCLVLMDGSETNFSGWRGAVDEARKGFRSRQKNMIKRFHSPVYRFQVRRWMAEDRTLRAAARRSDVNVFGHNWNPPSWSYIDPVGDATGDILRLQNNLTSPRRLHAERGRDVEKINSESIEDNSNAITMAKREAAKLNSKFPDDPPVQWRELINLPLPGNTQLTLADPNQVAVQKMQAEQSAEAASV